MVWYSGVTPFSLGTLHLRVKFTPFVVTSRNCFISSKNAYSYRLIYTRTDGIAFVLSFC